MTESFTHIRDFIHAQFCYQMFITPIPFPIERKYREFAQRACEFIEVKQSEIIHLEEPRHHVIHRFIPDDNTTNPKKILITHGWSSRAAYMIRLIRYLHAQGYEVFALDFPAHGDAKGYQLPWTDAVMIIKEVINQFGPFYGVIGHSFGGSMLLNTLNLSGQLPEMRLQFKPECAVLIASPTQMRMPVGSVARRFKLSAHGYLQFRHLILQQGEIDPKLIQLRHFIDQSPDTQFLCIHGEEDETIPAKESINFCSRYSKAQLQLLPDADHVSVLFDDRVERLVAEFLSR